MDRNDKPKRIIVLGGNPDPFRVYLWFTLWTIEVVERHRNYKTLNSTHTDPHRAEFFCPFVISFWIAYSHLLFSVKDKKRSLIRQNE